MLLVALATSSGAQAANVRADNRCPTVTTASSVAYHCWAAYPEAFYAGVYARSEYQLTWKVNCDGTVISGGKIVKGFFKVIVNQFTSTSAYALMISHDVCKIDVETSRTSGSGSIAMELVINQNHPLPAHN